MKKLINLLTEKQIETASTGRVVYLTNAAHGKMLIAQGFDVVKQNARNYHLSYSLARELQQHINAHGEAVKVVSVEDKYSDNNGAYEVATLEDAEGKQFKINNMYANVCFRLMSEAEIIAFSVAND